MARIPAGRGQYSPQESPAEDMAWTQLLRVVEYPSSFAAVAAEVRRRSELFLKTERETMVALPNTPQMLAISSVWDDIVNGRWPV
ncbi:MAG TPA: hypothetical protein VNN79_08010 [Actinomycetota bacterium]|nr:hypothetical protein [Actinomycetota bacterium]